MEAPVSRPICFIAGCCLLLLGCQSSAVQIQQQQQPPSQTTPFNEQVSHHDFQSGDYSNLENWFETKIEDHCPSTDYFYVRTELPSIMGEGGLSSFNSFRYSHPDLSAQQKLRDILVGTRTAGPYLKQRVGYLVGVGAGVLLFGLFLVLAALSPSGKLRKMTQTRGAVIKRRRRVDYNSVPRGWKVLLSLSILAMVSLVGGTSLMGILGSADLIQEVQVVVCDTWLQFKGFYFGALDYTFDSSSEVARLWRGQVDQFKRIYQIAGLTEPIADNPLKLQIMSEYGNLQEYLTAKNATVADLTIDLSDSLNLLSAVVSETVTQSGNESSSFGVTPLLAKVAAHQNDIFRNDANATIQAGYAAMDEKIDTYVGADSKLLQAAYTACLRSLEALRDAGGFVLFIIDHMEKPIKSVKTYAVALGSIAIVTLVLSLLAAFYGLFCFWKASREMRASHYCTAQTIQRLGVATSLLCAMAGLCILFFFLCLAASGFGADFCGVIDTNVMTNGEWEILGPTIMEQTYHMNTDMITVLNTCVRRDGNGNVANALQIQQSIDSLELILEEAKTDIITTLDGILDTKNQDKRAGLMETLYQEIALLVASHQNEEILQSPFAMEKAGSFLPYFLDTDIPDLQKVYVFCLALTATEDKLDIFQCLGNLNYPMNPANELVKLLNAFLAKELPWWTDTSGGIPRKIWCPSQCPTSYCENLAVESAGPIELVTIEPGYAGDEAPELIEAEATLRGVDPSSIPDEVKSSSTVIFKQMVFVEKWLEFSGSPDYRQAVIDKVFTNPKHWLIDGAEISTWKDFQDNAVAKYSAKGAELKRLYEEMRDEVSGFTNKTIIPVMDSVLAEAKEVLNNGNCQFIGTAIDAAIYKGNCEYTFPKILLIAYCCLGSFFGLLLGLFGVYKLLSYCDDLYQLGFVNQEMLTPTMRIPSEHITFLGKAEGETTTHASPEPLTTEPNLFGGNFDENNNNNRHQQRPPNEPRAN